MPKVRSVTVGLRRLYKHPWIDFENFTIEGSITVDLEDGETPIEAVAKSFPILREQMIATYKEFRPKKPVKESK